MLHELSGRACRTEAAIVAVLSVVDARRLYLQRACPSMFAYCTEVLNYSEHVAYHRIRVARAAREFPVILEMLADGRLHLTAVALLNAHLTAENAGDLLGRAVHKTKRQIQALIAEIAPRPDVPTTVRKLPAPRRTEAPPPPSAAPAPPAPTEAAAPQALTPKAAAADPTPPPAPVAPPRPAPRAVLEPLAPARYRVQFTASQELHDKLTRLEGLLRSQVRDGGLAAVVEIAVTEKLARVEARKFGKTDHPRKTVHDVEDPGEATRPIPMPIRRAVFARDGGRCTYVDKATGRRCSATEDLEFHHIIPWAVHREHRVEGICLHCRGHNQYQATLDFGVEHMAKFRRGRAEEPRASYDGVMPAPGERRVAYDVPPPAVPVNANG